MTAYGTLVVCVSSATKQELPDRARENDRSLSAAVRRAIREHLELYHQEERDEEDA